MINYCRTPYDEIVPGLHVGGHDYSPDGTIWARDVVIADEFDLVISLYQRAGHGPADGVAHIHLRIPDGYLGDADLADVRTLADWAAEAVRDGKRVLVRCQAGLNRSSLVAAFTLLRLGHTDPVALIREKRSPDALFNTHFQRYIADEARRIKTSVAA